MNGSIAREAGRIPVILDTDIGSDIDDTWALAFLLKSPELDLKLVVTEMGDTTYRARIAARMLENAGRIDVPIGIGIPMPDGSAEQQRPWIEGYELADYPGRIHEDGVEAMIGTIMGSREPTTLICIGPLHNIAVALDREPRIAERARFVGMHGSIRRGYGNSETVVAEWNVRVDPPACRRVFAAPWPVTITPLDTCGIVSLDGTRYRAVRDCRDPLVRAVLDNYRVWTQSARGYDPEVHSSVLFDTVAVYLAFSQDLLQMERLGVRVTDDGYTVLDDAVRLIDCAMAWRNLPAFGDLLVQRLTTS